MDRNIVIGRLHKQNVDRFNGKPQLLGLIPESDHLPLQKLLRGVSVRFSSLVRLSFRESHNQEREYGMASTSRVMNSRLIKRSTSSAPDFSRKRSTTRYAAARSTHLHQVPDSEPQVGKADLRCQANKYHLTENNDQHARENQCA